MSSTSIPSFLVSSSEGGTDGSIYAANNSAPMFQISAIWDGAVSYRSGYAFQTFGIAYNVDIAGTTERLGESSILMHSGFLSIGQAQYFNLSKKGDDFAFVVTPWAGMRCGFLESFSTPNERQTIASLDTTIQPYASYRVFEGDTLQGYAFQQLQRGNSLQWQAMLSLSLEVRVQKQFHFGIEPYVFLGFQPLYRQNIDYADVSTGVMGRQVLLSRGTSYGVNLTFRVALWQE